MSIDALLRHDKAYGMQVWSQALGDESQEVRVAAGEALVLLCNSGSAAGGAAGVIKDFCPLLSQFWAKAKEPGKGSYQHRITVAKICALLSVFDSVWKVVSSMFVEALKDSVPNVVLAALSSALAAPELRKSLKAEIAELKSHSSADIAAAAAKLS
jgi:hypothetical protein